MTNLFLKEMRANRGGILGWTLGLGFWGFLATVLFPSIGEQFGGMEFPEFYEAFGPISAIGELSGFLSLEVFSFAVPIALGIYALVLGTGVLGGEEDDGTLELLLALPLPRWKLVLAKALAIAASLAIVALGLCLSVWIGIQAIGNQIEVAVGAGDLALVALQSWFLVLALAAISLFLGAYLPHRRHASVLAAFVLAGSYLLESLGQIAEDLDPFRPLALNHYYDAHGLMVSGPAWQDAVMLVGIAVVFLVLALVAFERRNVTVGAWPWQRPTVSEEAWAFPAFKTSQKVRLCPFESGYKRQKKPEKIQERQVAFAWSCCPRLMGHRLDKYFLDVPLDKELFSIITQEA